MKNTIAQKNFLLSSNRAESLYHDYAETMPIIDYHCHLSPKTIAENRQFPNLSQVWLAGDHYKWRALRTCGVPERFITGDASDWEKFEKWSETVPKTLRSPLYHWTHLELKRPFGITDRYLNAETAKEIWAECNEKLADPGFAPQMMLKEMNVEVVCTTDDPTDSLEFHTLYSKSQSGARMYPAFRPDRALRVEDAYSFLGYVHELSRAAGISITSYDRLLDALRLRCDYFAAHGCRVSDHGLPTMYADDYTESQVKAIFKKLLQKKPLAAPEISKFKSALLHELGIMVLGTQMGPAVSYRSAAEQQFPSGARHRSGLRLRLNRR